MSKEHVVELTNYLKDLQRVVSRMSALYDKHEELNNDVDIQAIVPMSLDEWALQIDSTIRKIELDALTWIACEEVGNYFANENGVLLACAMLVDGNRDDDECEVSEFDGIPEWVYQKLGISNPTSQA